MRIKKIELNLEIYVEVVDKDRPDAAEYAIRASKEVIEEAVETALRECNINEDRYGSTSWNLIGVGTET